MALKYVPGPDEETGDTPRLASAPKSRLARVHQLWRLDSTLSVCFFVGLPILILVASTLGDWLLTAAVMLGLLIFVLVTTWAARRWGPRRPVIEARCTLCGQSVNDQQPLAASGGKRCPECGSSTR